MFGTPDLSIEPQHSPRENEVDEVLEESYRGEAKKNIQHRVFLPIGQGSSTEQLPLKVVPNLFSQTLLQVNSWLFS